LFENNQSGAHDKVPDCPKSVRSRTRGRRGTFRCGGTLIRRLTERKNDMDKDRIEGAGRQAKGAVKEAAGKIMGDKKLETEGKGDKIAGKAQNAVGGLKDALRGK
jgi:uncharacterized protein YjbJ (UPF0337 family)